jgi:uncharacterized RDD family membrane protein YckC
LAENGRDGCARLRDVEESTNGIALTAHLEGVVYRRQDCLGFLRRLLIEVIDIPVWFALNVLVCFTVWIAVGAPEDDRSMSNILIGSMLSTALLYFVLLKHSRFRTLGYVVAGARIVNLQGGKPSLVSLFVRMLFGFIGPMNVLVDLFWITSDTHRQALRDKFARTYVVRQNAAPSGRGRIAFPRYSIFGANFLFQEVRLERPAQ